jgi:hypothetical protein
MSYNTLPKHLPGLGPQQLVLRAKNRNIPHHLDKRVPIFLVFNPTGKLFHQYIDWDASRRHHGNDFFDRNRLWICGFGRC